jgi:hypothetical protein
MIGYFSVGDWHFFFENQEVFQIKAGATVSGLWYKGEGGIFSPMNLRSADLTNHRIRIIRNEVEIMGRDVLVRREDYDSFSETGRLELHEPNGKFFLLDVNRMKDIWFTNNHEFLKNRRDAR